MRAVAGDGDRTYAALTSVDKKSVIEARTGTAVAWTAQLPASAAALARGGSALYAATTGNAALRGDPGALVTVLDPATGKVGWSTAFDSTEWALISSLAATDDGCLVGGSFSGTLRAGEQLAPDGTRKPGTGSHVVSTAGVADGFVARLGKDGEVRWLVRLGGAGADAVQGVAIRSDRIAIAGTFSGDAELGGVPLTPIDERSPTADVFVAELDARGARKWSTTFGSRADDAVAGVAIDGGGKIAVAATARDVMQVGDSELVAQGASDAVVTLWRDGRRIAGILIGGPGFDGASSIVASGDHFVVGGFFAGSLRVGDRVLEAGGGDDAFVAVLDGEGRPTSVMHASGPGREEIAALAAVPNGFVAGVAHTAAADIDGSALPAPADPASGAALVGHGL